MPRVGECVVLPQMPSMVDEMRRRKKERDEQKKKKEDEEKKKKEVEKKAKAKAKKKQKAKELREWRTGRLGRRAQRMGDHS